MDKTTGYDQNHIVGELKNIVEDLGHVYMEMADNYPKLISLMDEKIQALSTTGGKKTPGFHGLDDMEGAVAYLQKIVQSEGTIFSELSEKDSRFLNQLEEELNQNNVFEAHIESIEDDSSELELISLNAMVTALKAGKHGGAFPYITEELQSVSKRSAQLSNNLKDHGTNLDKVFRSFLGNIQTEKSDLTQAMEMINKNLEDMLELVRDYKGHLNKFLEDLQDGVGGIKNPLYHIIQEVQKHDIVRQSIDHVILSFDKGNRVAHQSVEDELDYLTYEHQVYSFCSDILTEIQSGIEETYKLFYEKSEDLSKLMIMIQSSGKQFLMQSGSDSYSHRIQAIQSSITVTTEVFKKGYNRDYLKKSLDVILQEISKLEDSSSGFARIINWVKTINISSRVEAAKLPHLENMNFIIENINNRTDSIESNVESIIRIIGHIRKNTDKLFSNYFKDFANDSQQLDRFIRDLKNGLNQVADSHERVDASTVGVVRVGQDFDEFFHRTQEDLRNMQRLISKMDEVIRVVDTRKELFHNRLEETLSKSEYDSWELRGNEIRDLIEKFTIFIHKKKADMSQNLEIDDEGAASGEVTLF